MNRGREQRVRTKDANRAREQRVLGRMAVVPPPWHILWQLAQRGDAAGLEAYLRRAVLRTLECADGVRQLPWHLQPRALKRQALEIAARNDHAAAVAVLLRWHAHEHRKEFLPGLGPWFGALQFAALHNSCHAAALLVSARASVNEKCRRPGHSLAGNAIWLAARMGHKNMMEFAVAAGADVNQHNGTYLGPPVHAAAAHGHVDIVQYLLGVKVSVDSRAVADGATPLRVAAIHKQVAVIDALVQAKASVRDGDAGSALLVACKHLDVVEQLLAAGAAVGVEALRAAVQSGSAAVVSRLLQARAFHGWADSTGCTVLDIAAEARRPLVAKVLLRAKAIVYDRTPVGRQTAARLAEMRLIPRPP